MSLRFSMPYALWVDGDGVPAAGWKLYFYATGTDTPQNTYSNNALTIANANPVVANADGYWGPIFLSSTAYKVVLKDENDVQIWSADPVSGRDTSQGTNVRVVTTSFTVTDADDTIICNASGDIPGTLPDPTAETGRTFTVTNISSSSIVTMSSLGGATIDGATSFKITQRYQSLNFRSTGTTYVIV